jgi:serine protease
MVVSMSKMKRWALIALVGLAAAGLVNAPAGSAAAGGTTAPSATGRALIAVRTPSLPSPETSRGRYRDALASSRERLNQVAERESLDVAARSVPGGFLTVALNGRSLDQLRAQLADDPLVSEVGLEHRAQPRYVPNDPYLYTPDPHAPGQDLAGWNVLRTGAETAWNISRGSGAEVAVIDSGVDVSHPELAGRISGTNNTCTGILGCQGTGVTDTDGHGTHVAGLACGAGDNQAAIASIGFGCSIYAIKSDLTWTSIINSIYAAVSHGSDAISMSFGGGASPTEIAQLRNALSFAFTNGSIPVAAGANTPSPSPSNNYPAQILQPEGTGPDLANGIGLVVTSASHAGNRSAFAQRTSGVSVAAYGSATDQISGGQQGILSSFPPAAVDADIGAGAWPEPCQCRTSVLGDNRYAYLVGTSMATPQVAGLVALMRAAKSNISAGKAIKLIKETAGGCGSYSPNGNGLGWGIIRSDRAVAAAAQKDIKPPRSKVRSARKGHAPGRGRVAVLRLKRFDKGRTAECAKDIQIPVTGVKAVSVFASTNGGPYHRIAKTRKEKILFGTKPGRRYRFFSVAVDKAGNRESAPTTADAKLRIGRGRR